MYVCIDRYWTRGDLWGGKQPHTRERHRERDRRRDLWGGKQPHTIMSPFWILPEMLALPPFCFDVRERERDQEKRE